MKYTLTTWEVDKPEDGKVNLWLEAAYGYDSLTLARKAAQSNHAEGYGVCLYDADSLTVLEYGRMTAYQAKHAAAHKAYVLTVKDAVIL